MTDSAVSARLRAAVEARVAAGAPGALARLEAPRAALTWGGSAGQLALGKSRGLWPDDAFRAASVTKSVSAAVAVRLAREGAWRSTSHSPTSFPGCCLSVGRPSTPSRGPRRASCWRTRGPAQLLR